jgi:hypothetical protein
LPQNRLSCFALCFPNSQRAEMEEAARGKAAIGNPTLRSGLAKQTQTEANFRSRMTVPACRRGNDHRLPAGSGGRSLK